MSENDKVIAVAILCVVAIGISGFNALLIQDINKTQQEHLDEVKGRIEVFETELKSLNETLNIFNVTKLLDTLETVYSELDVLSSELERLEKSIPENTVADVYEAAHKSVVLITTSLGQGSGFLFGNQSLILTNNHVVEQATQIEVLFYDRTMVNATLIASDAYSDVAVIRVEDAPSDALALELGNSSEVWIGQQVVAIGNPLGLTGSLSSGYISQINKRIDLPPLIVPVLQLDITIAPGSSGGPLLDLYGKVIGITNAGTSVGFNFAIPSNLVRRAATSLIDVGLYRHPFIGFSGVELTPDTVRDLKILSVDAFQPGLLIWEVVPETPAEEAGLRGVVQTQAPDGSEAYEARDIILEVDGRPMYTFDDWSAYVEENVSPGQTITLTLWRSGEIVSIKVTATHRPDS